MKTVIDVNTFSHKQVPKNWIECSVCGEYYQPESYRKEDETHQTRTNCEVCYNMPYEEMKDLGVRINYEVKKSRRYLNAVMSLRNIINYENNSISVEDMIKYLSELPKNSRLVITQEGYYAQGNLAQIYSPEEQFKTEDITYFSIGHSSQNY